MEETTWKKDDTPYLIFECAKCKQYQYVKTTQKGKKCLRCGRNHTVSNILNSGEVVNGMTAAVQMVKKRQDKFGKKELGHKPEFRAFGDFTVAVKKSRNSLVDNDESSEETARRFKHNEIAVMACTKGLTRRFQKKGVLIRLDDYSYTVKM